MTRNAGKNREPDDASGTSDDPRRIFLRQWIAANEQELGIALRPIGGSLADSRGIGPTDATTDLLVEVVKIALGEACAGYDLSYVSPRLWLLKIAHIVGRRWREDARKSARRHVGALSVSEHGSRDVETFPSDQTINPSATVLDKMWMRQRLDHLSPEDRIIVEYQIFDDLTYAESAGKLGIAEGTARVRFHRAIKRLRQMERYDDTIIANDLRAESGPGVVGIGQVGKVNEKTNG